MTSRLIVGALLGFSGLAYGSMSSNVVPCPTANLSYYESNFVSGTLGTFASSFNNANSTGCSIGVLVFSDFAFPNPVGTGGIQLDTASDILVTPGATSLGFSQANGTPFTAALGQTATYQIEYGFFIDPAPVVEGADLSLDPPSGGVTVLQSYCTDSELANFSGSFFCFNPNNSTLSTSQNLMVTPAKTFDSIVFSPPANIYGEVATTISLVGPASFDSIGSNEYVTGTPEPSYYLMIAAGLFALGGARSRLRGKLPPK